MSAPAYDRFAGFCALLAGVAGFLYSIAFVVLQDRALQGLFLLLGGLLSSAVFVALYHRLVPFGGGFALWALLLGVVGAFGATMHGGYDLANALSPPPVVTDLPSETDPRGLLTFGATGIALLVISWLVHRHKLLPVAFAGLGYLLAVLLLVLYLGRLLVLDASNPVVLVPAVLTGFIVNPAWYIWLGLMLWRSSPAGQ